MTTNYLRKNENGRGARILKTTAALAVFVFLLNYFLPAGAPSSFFRSLFAPLWKMENRILPAQISLFGWFSSKNALLKENLFLQKELEDAKTKLLDRNILLEENEELRELLGRNHYERLAAANVLARPPVSLYDTFVIDLGNEDGIRPNDVALALSLVPIGRVVKVGQNTSLLKLYSSPGEKMRAVFSSSKTEMEIVGQGGGNFGARVPKDLNVAVGETLFLPGTNRPVGVVGSISSRETDSFKEVFVKSPVNVFKLDKIEIIKS